MQLVCAYPDSVRRVSPPKTTMPNTLAALPSNQYATLLDVVLGKLLDFPSAAAVASASDTLPALACSIAALVRRGCVDFHRTECRTDGRDERVDAGMADRIGELRHWLHEKRRRERRGAAVRSCGRVLNMEAIGGEGQRAVQKSEGEKQQVVMSSTLAFRWFEGPTARQARIPAYSVDKRKARPTRHRRNCITRPSPAKIAVGQRGCHVCCVMFPASTP
jgi:hypothetical protein